MYFLIAGFERPLRMSSQILAEFETHCSNEQPPKELSIFALCVTIVLTVLNTPGNFLVISVIAIDPYKKLRTPFNYLLANLAVADLLVGIVSDPFSAYFFWKKAVNSDVTDLNYKINHMSYFISCTASVLSLAALAMERYLAIRHPHNYRNRYTGKRILLTITIIWFISLSLPWIYLEVKFITYAFIFANSAVAVAVFITVFTYYLVVKALKTRSQDIDGGHSAGNENDQFSGGNEDALSSRVAKLRQENAMQVERKVTKMFLLVLLALLCCYAPSTVLIYALSFCTSCSCAVRHWFKYLQHLFVLANSSVNFFCYALRSPRFLAAIKFILRFRRRNVSDTETQM
jgi:hypothetical protein